MVRFLWWVTALLAVSCSAPGGECPNRYTQAYDSVIRWAHIVDGFDRPLLVTTGYDSVQCNFILEDGVLGPETCRAVDTDDWISVTTALEEKLAVAPEGAGVRIITEEHALHVSPGSSTVRVVELVGRNRDGWNTWAIERVFVTPVAVYVVWKGHDAQADEWTAGLGLLDTADIVTPLGMPFYRGPPTAPSGISVFGGWDPNTGHIWLDSPDGLNVLELDAVGSIIRIAEHGMPQPATPNITVLADWTKLPDGRWLGTNGEWVCLFDLLDRTGQQCGRLEWDDSVPAGFTIPYDLYLDRQGQVWTATHISPDDPAIGTGIIVGRWDGETTINGTFTEMRLTECDFLINTPFL